MRLRSCRQRRSPLNPVQEKNSESLLFLHPAHVDRLLPTQRLLRAIGLHIFLRLRIYNGEDYFFNNLIGFSRPAAQ